MALRRTGAPASPRSAVSGGSHSPKVSGPRGAPSAVTATAASPVSSRAQGGLADGGRGEHEHRARTCSAARRGVPGGDPAQPPQDLGHVRAEHPPVGVAFVDHHVAQPAEAARPSGRAGAAANGAACPAWSAGSWRAPGPRSARPPGCRRRPRRAARRAGRARSPAEAGRRPAPGSAPCTARCRPRAPRSARAADSRVTFRGGDGRDDHVPARGAGRPRRPGGPRARAAHRSERLGDSRAAAQPGQPTRRPRRGRDMLEHGQASRPRAASRTRGGARRTAARDPASKRHRRHRLSVCHAKEGASNTDLV